MNEVYGSDWHLDITNIVIVAEKNSLDQKIIIVRKPLWEGLGLIWKFIEMNKPLKTESACAHLSILKIRACLPSSEDL